MLFLDFRRESSELVLIRWSGEQAASPSKGEDGLLPTADEGRTHLVLPS